MSLLIDKESDVESRASEKFSKGILILKPDNGKSPVKVKHPETFESLQAFNPCKKYRFDIVGYESIHEVIPKLAEMDDWMPVLGWPPPAALPFVGDENKTMYRFKREGTNTGGVTIIEPMDDKGVLEIDNQKLAGFNSNSPEEGIRRYCAAHNIDCDVTWILSASQRPNSNVACLHLHFEFDEEHTLSLRKIFAGSLNTDVSVYNGTNPVYTSNPIFKKTLEGKALPDPIKNRVGFIKGKVRKLSMPNIASMEVSLKKIGKSVKGKKANPNGCSLTYLSEKHAINDIKGGKNYHDATLYLSMHYANKKYSADKIKYKILGFMEEAEVKDSRWQTRVGELEDICHTALKKVKNKPFDQGKITYGKTLNASEVTQEKVEWDVKDFIYKSRTNLLAGDRGAGKSTFCSYIAAQYTKGGDWFGTNKVLPKKIVGWLSAEEEYSAEILSRLMVNNADLNNVRFIDPKVQRGGSVDHYDIVIDKNELILKLKQDDIEVLIVDTAFSFSGDANLNSASDMRGLMLTYGDIAKEADCTLILIVHLNKSSAGRLLDDIQGSAQITGVVRGALGLVTDDIESDIYLSAIKSSFSNLKSSTVKFKYLYKFAGIDSDTSFGTVVPSDDQPKFSADDMRSLNHRRRSEKAKTVKKQTGNDIRLVIAKVVDKAGRSLKFAVIESLIETYCQDYQIIPPGRDAVRKAFNSLLEVGVLKNEGAKQRPVIVGGKYLKMFIVNGTGEIGEIDS